jgi:hypothetical protein
VYKTPKRNVSGPSTNIKENLRGNNDLKPIIDTESDGTESSDGQHFNQTNEVKAGQHPTWTTWAVDAFQQWLGIMPTPLPTKLGSPAKNNRPPRQENYTFMEIPIHFFALLTYPEDDTLAGRRAPFFVMRETELVRQRRAVFMALSAFAILLRYSSFDFFCVLIALLNWIALYGLKNSRKVNVTLAKRYGQRFNA